MSLKIADWGVDGGTAWDVYQDLTTIAPRVQVDDAGVVSVPVRPPVESVDYLVRVLVVSSSETIIRQVEQLSGAPRTGWDRYEEPAPPWGELYCEQVYAAPPALDVSYVVRHNDAPFEVEVEVASGADPIRQPQPRELILLHMLSHACDALMGQGLTYAAQWEPDALERENRYRESVGQLLRANDKVFVKEAPPDTPPPDPADPEKPPASFQGETYDLGGCGCFVATAAYGSPFESEVESLRRFRDDILLRSRAGAAFFERFYRQYYRVSPPLAAAIEREPALREAARWIITPLVRYLDIARTFPDAPLEQVPEPWRSFLADMRDRLEAWTVTTGLPEDFAGMSPRAAAAELALALRHLLRREDSRQRYVARLAALGALPIACAAGDYDACAAALTAAGWPADELGRLLIVSKEAAA
jgi:hypothetical protein